MKRGNSLWVVFTFFIFFASVRNLQAQVFLQLERKFEVKAVKFGVGDRLRFQSRLLAGEWQERKIDQLLLTERSVVFTDGYVAVDDITKVMMRNRTAAMAGYMFSTFGAGWFLFGGIAHVATPYTFSTRDAVIGSVGLGLGALLTHVIAKKVFTIGTKSRLRLVDTRFTFP